MGKNLRIVAFNVFPPAYRVVAEWAARHGHRLVLLVTMPRADDDRYGVEHPDLASIAPEDQDVLVTKRLRGTAAPVIRALEPDLVISATFPRRIPPEVTSIPRYGALNVHPSLLPRWRGPNPQRAIYEGDGIIGVTLHRMDPEFDAGPILGRRALERPADMTAQDLLYLWLGLIGEVLEEGARRAVAGELGEPQDHHLATYCAPFTDAERWLDWTEPARIVQRRAAALNVATPTARAWINGRPVQVLEVRALRLPAPVAAPGTVLHWAGDVGTIRVADGAVSIRTRTMPVPPVMPAAGAERLSAV